jgi:signal peptidase I
MLTSNQGNTSVEVACGLADEIVRTFGGVRLRVFGTSMVPSILPGDVVSIRQASLQDISVGDVVVFLRMGRLFVHRVVDRKVPGTVGLSADWRLITRGDRLRHNDPPVSSPELLGRVVSIERDNREVKTLAGESNPGFIRLMLSSDRAAYLYVRLAVCWRNIFLRRAKCQA